MRHADPTAKPRGLALMLGWQRLRLTIGVAALLGFVFSPAWSSAPLFVVMGHAGCGAVTAALDAKLKKAKEPERIEALVKLIEPGLKDLDLKPAYPAVLGAAVDTEANGQPTAGASGDDANGDDEDGVAFPQTLVPGTDGTMTLTVGSVGGVVSCWIDFDRNGSWLDAGEAVVVDATLVAGSVTSRTFPVPVGSPPSTPATGRPARRSTGSSGPRRRQPDGLGRMDA